MARDVFLYRLDVTYPEGSQRPGWEPPDWREGLAEDIGRAGQGGLSGCGADWCADFTWPRRRLYVSKTAARARKRLLERFGATVTIERSLPVEWPP